jgi:uncharacterized protein DUF4232
MRPPARALVALACCATLAACGGGHKRAATKLTNPSPPAPASTASTTPTGKPAAPARLATCTPAQLRLRVVSSQGATGHLETTFAFRNSSGTRCRLFGFPGARMLSATRRPLRTIVERGDGFFSFPRHGTEVVLQPGGSARFSLGWSDNNAQGGSPATCPRADRLEVTPPNDYSFLEISVRSLYFAPCDGRITASPVTR